MGCSSDPGLCAGVAAQHDCDCRHCRSRAKFWRPPEAALQFCTPLGPAARRQEPPALSDSASWQSWPEAAALGPMSLKKSRCAPASRHGSSQGDHLPSSGGGGLGRQSGSALVRMPSWEGSGCGLEGAGSPPLLAASLQTAGAASLAATFMKPERCLSNTCLYCRSAPSASTSLMKQRRLGCHAAAGAHLADADCCSLTTLPLHMRWLFCSRARRFCSNPAPVFRH